MYCADCEQLDNYFFKTTTFWLFFPTGEGVSKGIYICGDGNYPAEQHDSHCLSVKVQHSQIKPFLLSLYGEFEPPELANIKITTTQGEKPELADIGRLLNADVLINRYNSQWIVESIESNKYQTHFQAIHKVQKDGSILPFAHEGLFRMLDDKNNTVPPGHVFSLAESSDLIFSLDLVARRSAVSCFKKSGLNGKLFINFDPSSIYDPSYCLRATASAINQLGIRPEDVVFEITETHKAKNMSVLKGILNFYRNSGFGVALDDIGSGWSGLNLLHKLRPDYVKIDMDLVRDIHIDNYKRTIVHHLVQIAHDNDIRVIAEGIENEEEFTVIKELKADYVQGFMFNKPEFKEPTCTPEEAQKIDAALSGIH